METYNIVVNNVLVEVIEQQKRSKEVMSDIILDRVYTLRLEAYKAKQPKPNVEVYTRSGEAHVYEVTNNMVAV